MKKKFLSLMMAAAVVATTSVSAFADDNTTIQVQPKSERTVPVEITGNITDNSGHVVSGTVSVTVPTTATFKVNASGELTSPSMKITSNSNESVQVIASKFIDANGAEGIELVKQSSFIQASAQRKQVWLKLVGGEKEVSFTSENNGTMYKNDTDKINEGENYVLGTVTQDEPLTLSLKGEGGTPSEVNNTAIQNNFKLILKIKKLT